MRGIRRNWGQTPAKKKAGIDVEIMKMADVVDLETRKGLRDRAFPIHLGCTADPNVGRGIAVSNLAPFVAPIIRLQ